MREIQAGSDNKRYKEHDHPPHNNDVPFLLMGGKGWITLRPVGP